MNKYQRFESHFMYKYSKLHYKYQFCQEKEVHRKVQIIKHNHPHKHIRLRSIYTHVRLHLSYPTGPTQSRSLFKSD